MGQIFVLYIGMWYFTDHLLYCGYFDMKITEWSKNLESDTFSIYIFLFPHLAINKYINATLGLHSTFMRSYLFKDLQGTR